MQWKHLYAVEISMCSGNTVLISPSRLEYLQHLWIGTPAGGPHARGSRRRELPRWSSIRLPAHRQHVAHSVPQQ